MRAPSAAAIYARISSDDGTALGVNRQVKDCRDLAERLGWTVAAEYVDNDISAYSGRKKRPAYQQLLDDIRDGYRDAVIVYHLDRLTRRPIELEQFVDVLSAAKAQLRFVAGADVDIASGDGLFVLRMLAAVAANESASKSRRVSRKLEDNAAKGKPHGGARRPFGYANDKVTIIPEEAEIIRTLAERFIAGESFRSLTSWLQDQGIRSVWDKEWTTSTLRDILISARIAGLRASKGIVVAPAVWEPIITVEQRERILAIVEQNRNSNRRPPRRYLLSGMLRCAKCDHTLYSQPRERTRRYVCLAGPDHRGCGRLTVVAEPVEQLITDAVLYRLDTPELAAALQGRRDQSDETARLSETLATDRTRLADLATIWADGAITRAEWITARQAIEARITATEAKLTRLTRSDSLAGLVGNGTSLRTHWADLNLTRQHTIIRAVLDYATVLPGNNRSGFDHTRVEPQWRV